MLMTSEVLVTDGTRWVNYGASLMVVNQHLMMVNWWVMVDAASPVDNDGP